MVSNRQLVAVLVLSLVFLVIAVVMSTTDARVYYVVDPESVINMYANNSNMTFAVTPHG